MRGRAWLLVALALACTGTRHTEKGVASWYGPGFQGRLTASGEVFDMESPSAAHRTLPLGSLVEVRNLDNGRSIVVRINDRGPWVRGRILDLSLAAARDLGMVETGLARVRLRVLDDPEPPTRSSYWIQVGAFRDEAKAHSLAAALRGRHPATTVRKGNDWHRVQIPHQGDRRSLEAVLRELQRQGHEPFVIRDPNAQGPRSKT